MNKNNSKKRVHSVNDTEWIDINDDMLMVNLGIRNPEVQPRDESVWTKTPQEKKLLGKLRRTCKSDDNYFHSDSFKRIPVKAKLIVYLKKNNKFQDSVHSIECWQHEIPNYLLFFREYNKKSDTIDNLVSKYVFNGKTYGPYELPFWY